MHAPEHARAPQDVHPGGGPSPAPQAGMDPQRYYDAFSQHYEDARHRGYHVLLDELESELVLRHAHGGRVLEAGCGTGLVLQRLARGCQAMGVDLSGGMLARARDRQLRVAQANLTRLPFADDTFDAVCSFKVLAHVPPIREALAELARVVRPGGHLILEFYNTLSVRYLVKRLKRPSRIAQGVHDEHVFTRYDHPWEIARHLPPSVEVVGWRGVRVLTPAAKLHELPVVGPLLDRAERLVADSPLGFLGGFLIVVARKR